MVNVGGWFDSFPLRGFSKIIEENDRWQIVLNGAGAKLKWWKEKSGTPEHIDFRMTGRDVWEREYRNNLLELNDDRINIKHAKEQYEKHKNGDKFTFIGDLFIWESLRRSAGDICMYESMALDPEWIHDYNRVYTDFYIKHYARLIEACGLPDGAMIYEDLGYSKGLACSPDTLEELYFPYYKELVDFFHEKRIPVMLHTCGGIEKALPLIINAGFDAINPMEVKAGCDTVRFAEKFGDKLAFIGGFDARILESGDKALIKRDVAKYIKDLKSLGARFFFGSDHSCSNKVEFGSYECAMETYKENMFY